FFLQELSVQFADTDVRHPVFCCLFPPTHFKTGATRLFFHQQHIFFRLLINIIIADKPAKSNGRTVNSTPITVQTGKKQDAPQKIAAHPARRKEIE
ncbi:MAG: hypothetical protein LUH13_03300, partial [Oscillospiraceae bacterium]|nr:hypothetical protein [Oscillospiraceae bacterium]